MALIGSDPRLDEILHLEPKFLEEFRRRPVEGFTYDLLEPFHRFEAGNRKACSDKVNRGCQSSESTSDNHNIRFGIGV
jgi:hypothetical protein